MPTAATRLKQAGYQTAAFVGAFPVHSRFGLNAGFDLYDDHFGETRAPVIFGWISASHQIKSRPR